MKLPTVLGSNIAGFFTLLLPMLYLLIYSYFGVLDYIWRKNKTQRTRK